MRKLIKIVLAVLAVGLFFIPRHGTDNASLPARTPTTWGAYSGNSDQTMAEFESSVGAKMDVHVIFWGWDSDFPETTAGAQGKTLLIFWDPEYGYDQINDGTKDAYVASFAESAKAYGDPIILVPFSEFNLNEAAWGNTVGTNTPEGFIAAWRRIHGIFRDSGASNVKFGLAYNNISIPYAAYSDFYPGDDYVDYVGVDGFNMDNSKTFLEIFQNSLHYAGSFGKPLWIFSTGSITPQAQFIYDLGQSGLPWIWFNQEPYNIRPESMPVFKSIL